MNILIGSNVHWWNAEAAYAAVIAKLLKDDGHRVIVLTRPGSDNEKKLRNLGLEVITEPDLNTQNPFKLIQSYFQLKNLLATENIQIINAHRSEGYPLYAFAKRSLASFRLIRTRGASRKVKPHWPNQILHGKWTDALIIPGRVVAERDLQGIDLPENSPHLIHYPIDILETSLLETQDNYRKQFNIPENHQVLAVVGRIRQEKGHLLLTESFQLLLEDFPQTILLILYRDTPDDLPEMLELQNRIRELGIEDKVRFDSEREDIRQLMAFADGGVVSSIDSEVICRVAVEFFSVGTPVAAMPTGCLPEIILEGVNGSLADEPTALSLKKAMARMLDNLPQLSEGAREDAETRFDPETMLKKTIHVFQQTLHPEHENSEMA
ncbi:MAG: glycosyltransferase family 4 protein [bacterium]